MNLDELQKYLHEWRVEQFDPKTITPIHQLIGMQEELGELAHAQLKYEQGIRGAAGLDIDPETWYRAKASDAIGDLCIFLMGYCSLNGWSLEALIRDTAEGVLRRNWKENASDGGETDGAGDGY